MRPLRHLAPAPLPSATRRRLMVVERGASLACRDDASEFDETTAITQLSGEPDAELAQRALARVAQGERSGKVFDSAVLAVSEAGSVSARRLIGLGLAAHGARCPRFTELVIIAPSDASAALREDLLLLTDELLASAERPFQVRLYFAAARESEQRSGTFWAVPEPDAHR